MDKVYRFYDRHASQSIVLEDYFGRYSESVESSTRQMVGETNEESIFRLMNVDVSQASTLLMTHYCRYAVIAGGIAPRSRSLSLSLSLSLSQSSEFIR